MVSIGIYCWWEAEGVFLGFSRGGLEDCVFCLLDRVIWYLLLVRGGRYHVDLVDVDLKITSFGWWIELLDICCWWDAGGR